jgi:poly(A) polymerase
LNSTTGPLEAVPQLARVIPRDAHPISRSRISPDALRVLYRLKEAGYQAFLVGGCVRDLMLGLEPKDFDVATNALPEDVRRLFRNCRLVGRRFRLAHVFFGREIIEVATFRAASAPIADEEPLADADLDDGVDEGDVEGDIDDEVDDDGPEGEATEAVAVAAAPVDGERDDVDRVVDEHGRILRDNVYGTIDQDVWRRDFTANALYYNIADFSVWDYTGGFEDVNARRLRLIGDPETRYREDPVRMLRAARFEAKLGFDIEPATAEPIASLRHLLADVPSARLFDETLKLFLTGHGARSYQVLQRRGLLEVLLPSVGQYLGHRPGSRVEQLLVRGLENTDARVRADRSVTPTFLFALLLYGPIAAAIERAPRDRWQDTGTILDAVDAVIRSVYSRVAIPRRFALGIRDMFAMQPRLESPRGRRALRMLENPRFRAAFDLLELRAAAGMADPALVSWWQRVQQAGPRDLAAVGAGDDQGEDADSDASGPTDADGRGEGGGRRRPRRRRRGRRSPRG